MYPPKRMNLAGVRRHPALSRTCTYVRSSGAELRWDMPSVSCVALPIIHQKLLAQLWRPSVCVTTDVLVEI